MKAKKDGGNYEGETESFVCKQPREDNPVT